MKYGAAPTDRKASPRRAPAMRSTSRPPGRRTRGRWRTVVEAAGWRPASVTAPLGAGAPAPTLPPPPVTESSTEFGILGELGPDHLDREARPPGVGQVHLAHPARTKPGGDPVTRRSPADRPPPSPGRRRPSRTRSSILLRCLRLCVHLMCDGCIGRRQALTTRTGRGLTRSGTPGRGRTRHRHGRRHTGRARLPFWFG